MGGRTELSQQVSLQKVFITVIGDGHSKVWVNGRIMIESESEYNPTQVWWVEVKTKKGEKGWITIPDDVSISGADYLE